MAFFDDRELVAIRVERDRTSACAQATTEAAAKDDGVNPKNRRVAGTQAQVDIFGDVGSAPTGAVAETRSNWHLQQKCSMKKINGQWKITRSVASVY